MNAQVTHLASTRGSNTVWRPKTTSRSRTSLRNISQNWAPYQRGTGHRGKFLDQGFVLATLDMPDQDTDSPLDEELGGVFLYTVGADSANLLMLAAPITSASQAGRCAVAADLAGMVRLRRPSGRLRQGKELLPLQRIGGYCLWIDISPPE